MTEQSAVRYTVRGAVACKAHTSAGNPCQAPAVRGHEVCQAHGASSPQAKAAAKIRLAALADPAIESLAYEMEHATESRDRLAAANSILDRAGYGRSQRFTTEDAYQILQERLMAARSGISDGSDSHEIEA